MQDTSTLADDRHHKPASQRIRASRKTAGRTLVVVASLGLLLILLIQILHTTGAITAGFGDWRPILYAYLLWAIAFGAGQVLIRGERGLRALFLLPAVFFTVAVVIFPTLFGIYIASLDWNLSSLEGPRFNGLNNLIALFNDTYYWNALRNMIFYTVAVLGEYAVAFGLALLLNAEIRARKFFRIVFLLPMMLSPVAVSWMIGKSLMEYRFGPAASLARDLGWDNPAFFASPWIARFSIQAMDAWVSIPFIMIRQGRRRECVAVVLACDVPDHAAGERDRSHHQDHFQIEARRHRHQRDGGRAGRRHRHRVELHLSRVPRSLECRIRHGARHVLSCDDHRVPDPVAAPVQSLDAEGRMSPQIQTGS
jgi:hypothetical protein